MEEPQNIHTEHTPAHPLARLSEQVLALADGPPYASVLAMLASNAAELRAWSQTQEELIRCGALQIADHCEALAAQPALSDGDVLALADAIDAVLAGLAVPPPLAEPSPGQEDDVVLAAEAAEALLASADGTQPALESAEQAATAEVSSEQAATVALPELPEQPEQPDEQCQLDEQVPPEQPASIESLAPSVEPSVAASAEPAAPAPAASALSLDDVLELDSVTGMMACRQAPASVGDAAQPPPAAPPSDGAQAVEQVAMEQGSEASAAGDSVTGEHADALEASSGSSSAPEAAAQAVTSDAHAADDPLALLWQLLAEAPRPLEQLQSPLTLESHKQELVSFLASDLRTGAAELNTAVEMLAQGEAAKAAQALRELHTAMHPSAEFFGLDTLTRSTAMVGKAASVLEGASPEHTPTLADAVLAVGLLWPVFATALDAGQEQRWPLEAIGATLEATVAACASAAAIATTGSASSGEGALSPELSVLLDDTTQQAATWGTTPLSLPPEKVQQLQFLVTDVKEHGEKLGTIVAELANIASRADAAAELQRISEAMAKPTREFAFRSLQQLIALVGDVGVGLPNVAETMLPELAVRLLGIQGLISQHLTALEVGMETTWPLGTLTRRVHRLLSGQPLARTILGWHRNEPDRVLELDGVTEGLEPPPTVPEESDRAEWSREAALAAMGGAAGGARGGAAASGSDQIRVDSAVIDALLDTVGELVLHRGRLQLITEQLRRDQPSNTTVAELARTSELIDRTMISLQTGIMGTRLMALGRLFDRYPRVVRDVARLADRDVELIIEGGHVTVDKQLLDQLADPLIAILRTIASSLVEPPTRRQELGKPAQATVRLAATHQGSQVVLTISDDGAGFDRADTERQVVAAGLFTPEQASLIPDDQLFPLLFERDVANSPLCAVGEQVRTGLAGSLLVRSRAGQGLHIEVVVPLKSAILPAVIVAVGGAAYTIPLQGVAEILALDARKVHSIGGSPCLRVREEDEVLALIDARRLFGDEPSAPARVALVLSDGQRKAALAVDGVLGKQDIVVRSIDEPSLRRGPFSGTALLASGNVSLVLDIQRTIASGSTGGSGAPPAEVPALAA